MLEKGYIYFCPANKLDDQFECLWDFSKYKDSDKEKIIAIVKESLYNFGIDISNLPLNEIFDDEIKTVNFIKEKDNNVSNEQIKFAIDTIKSFKNLEFSNEIKAQMEQILLIRNSVGVCSFAEENANQVMWVMYANNYNGYCIEYDIEKAILDNPSIQNDLLKVKYTDTKTSFPIEIFLKGLYAEILSKINHDIEPFNKNIFKDTIINLFTTKHSDWSFQKEWRFIGKPNNTDLILPIKAVYLGKNLSKINQSKIIFTCKKKGISVYSQYNDLLSLKINFNKIIHL